MNFILNFSDDTKTSNTNTELKKSKVTTPSLLLK